MRPLRVCLVGGPANGVVVTWPGGFRLAVPRPMPLRPWSEVLRAPDFRPIRLDFYDLAWTVKGWYAQHREVE